MRRRVRALLIPSLLALSPVALSGPALSEQNPAAGQQNLENPQVWGPAALPQAAAPAAVNRYPTSEEVFYVISCMEMNGKTGENLQKCSCAINALEARLSYDQYTDAKMVLALRQAGGRQGSLFRDTAPMKSIVNDFIRAQQGANEVCFGSAPGAKQAKRD